ncbi:hypothetical protein F4804DRAFT_332858 [Jackrogersella minutella]|nr:hypothetical protein F4804DRAFT_332858 [Jackrogersella minutella]
MPFTQSAVMPNEPFIWVKMHFEITGVPRYGCVWCSEWYVRPGNFRNHLERNHRQCLIACGLFSTLQLQPQASSLPLANPTPCSPVSIPHLGQHLEGSRTPNPGLGHAHNISLLHEATLPPPPSQYPIPQYGSPSLPTTFDATPSLNVAHYDVGFTPNPTVPPFDSRLTSDPTSSDIVNNDGEFMNCSSEHFQYLSGQDGTNSG